MEEASQRTSWNQRESEATPTTENNVTDHTYKDKLYIQRSYYLSLSYFIFLCHCNVQGCIQIYKLTREDRIEKRKTDGKTSKISSLFYPFFFKKYLLSLDIFLTTWDLRQAEPCRTRNQQAKYESSNTRWSYFSSFYLFERTNPSEMNSRKYQK